MTLSEQLEALDAKATAGPWEIGQNHHPCVVTVYDPQEDWHYTIADCGERNLEGGENDAALIVALRNAMPKIIAALRLAETSSTAGLNSEPPAATSAPADRVETSAATADVAGLVERMGQYEHVRGVLSDNDREFFAKVAASFTAQAQRNAELEAEIARLRKFTQPEWFYLAGDMSSDRCRFSVEEVIGEDWLWDNRAEGSAVVQIETATLCPDIWAVVHFFTEEEKSARGDGETYEVAEYASEEEARAALKGGTDA